MKDIKCRISTVSKIEEDTLFIKIKAEQDFGIDDFNELKEAAFQFGKGKRFYNIIQVGEYTLPDKDARELSCSKEGSQYKKADAFVIKTLPQKILGNLMMKINKPLVPTKCFNSVREAEKWLKTLKARRQTKAAF